MVIAQTCAQVHEFLKKYFSCVMYVLDDGWRCRAADLNFTSPLSFFKFAILHQIHRTEHSPVQKVLIDSRLKLQQLFALSCTS